MSATALGALRADAYSFSHDAVTEAERPQLSAVPANTIHRLDASWIDEILALQDVSADGQTILRDRAYMEDFFARGHDTIFGITDSSGRLIAQATTKLDVKLPSILRDSFNEASGAERHAIIGCVTVHPDARGQGLMGRLITLCVDEAQNRGMTDVHARVKLGNQASQQNFLKKGFTVAATGPSPEDATRTVDFLHLNI